MATDRYCESCGAENVPLVTVLTHKVCKACAKTLREKGIK
jgi:hypothetical protein